VREWFAYMLLELSTDGANDILLLFKPAVEPSLEAAAAEAVWLLLRCMPAGSAAADAGAGAVAASCGRVEWWEEVGGKAPPSLPIRCDLE
jgi:hypothetical protein